MKRFLLTLLVTLLVPTIIFAADRTDFQQRETIHNESRFGQTLFDTPIPFPTSSNTVSNSNSLFDFNSILEKMKAKRERFFTPIPSPTATPTPTYTPLPTPIPVFIPGGNPPLSSVSSSESSLALAIRHSKGNTDAKVTIFEFSDFECPYCKQFFTDTLPKITADYINTGKVRFVYKHRPLAGIHHNAVAAGTIAECSDQTGKFWEAHDKLFQQSSEWAGKDEATALNKMISIVVSLGINETDLRNCLKTPYGADRVVADMKEADTLNIHSTPTFLINGTLVTGAYSYEYFKSIIEEKLR